MKQFGIDVSRWQGAFDFAKAKAEGVTFVIIKGGGGDDGLYVDSRFAENYQKAKAQGLNVGCYWFSKALTVAQAQQEASYFYQHCCKGRQFELPVFMDVENKEQLALGKRALTDVVRAWLEKIESYGMYGGIYSFRAAFPVYFYDEELAAVPHWVASWTKTCSFQPMGIWQFGGETNLLRSNKIAGVVCDQDYLLTDYPSQIKAAGKNGFSPSQSAPPSQSTPPSQSAPDTCTVSLPVLQRGSNGGFVKTAQILLNAYFDAGLAVDGGFGTKTYAAVVAYQKNRGLTADGVIGRQTWRQLLC